MADVPGSTTAHSCQGCGCLRSQKQFHRGGSDTHDLPQFRESVVIHCINMRASSSESVPQFSSPIRGSNDREDRVAVCSAVRSYVGLAETAQVESVAELLEPGYRASPTLDTLLETLKMVARKFAANPPGSPNQYPALSGQIHRVARAYLNPYVLPQGKHAAVAINAAQALAALASPEFGTVITEVNKCCPAWFRQQLQRRLTMLLEEWKTKLGNGVAVHQSTKTVQEAFDQLQTD